MAYLILGLVLFLGAHSVRIVADGWRTQMLARMGEGAWKGAFTLVSVVGLLLIVWGFSLARHDPVVLWNPPVAMRHIAALLTLMAFILLAAAYVPRNIFKAKLHHPMVGGVKLWAFAHLLANGTLDDVLLFGAFMIWAIVDFSAARRRDRAAGTVYPAGTLTGTIITVIVGTGFWAVFALVLHGMLFGVRPFGG